MKNTEATPTTKTLIDLDGSSIEVTIGRLIGNKIEINDINDNESGSFWVNLYAFNAGRVEMVPMSQWPL